MATGGPLSVSVQTLSKNKHCCFVLYISIYIYIFYKKQRYKKTWIIKLEDLHSHKMQVKKIKKRNALDIIERNIFDCVPEYV